MELVTQFLAFLTPVLLPVLSWAKTDEELEAGEARLEGYAQAVKLEEAGSTALYWLLLVGLGVVALIVLFKDAKRTHLD